MNNHIIAKRSEDIIVLTYQDNIKKEIIISEINDYAEYFLGYKKEEIIGKSFLEILSDNTKTVIMENNAFNNDDDLFNILIKINNFSLKDKLGVIHEVKQKIFRTMSPNKNKINYEILMRDISISKKLDIFRNKSFADTKYIVNPLLGIIDEQSSQLELQLVLDFIHINHITAAIGVIRLETILDTESLIQSLKSMIDLIYLNTRSDDIVGYMGHNKIFIILMKCSSNDAFKVMTRLHKEFSRSLYNIKSSDISIIYSSLNNSNNSQELLEKLNVISSDLEKSTENTIVEVE